MVGKFQLFSGKLAPPLAVALPIDRSALVEDVLDASPAGVILVFAPGGYGKTSLLTQLFASLNAAGVPTGWVTLSGTENELERFVTYLTAAVERIEGAVASGVTAERMPAGSSGKPLADAMALLERMAAQGTSYGLFLDDFQEITNPDVLALVTELIAVLGPGQRLIIGSRFVPELGVPRLRAQGRLQEVNAQRLSFNLEETRLFLGRHRAGDLSDADLRLLFERTEGWAAALQLAALALSVEGNSTALIRRLKGTTVEIVDYLAHDVYATMHPELRSFLLDISVLESFCAQLCDAVGERIDSQQMIDRVRRNGLFLSPLVAADEWYRLHQLFREFMLGQLQREAPGRSALLHGRAARWYAAQDRPLYAVNHALLAGEQELAAELMSAVSREFLHTGRTTTLTHWSDVLAPEILSRHPGLLEDCTVAHITRHAHARALQLIGMIEEKARGHDTTDPASMVRAVLAAWSDRLDTLQPLIEQALASLPHAETRQRTSLLNIQSYVHLLHDDFDGARRMANSALGASHRTGAEMSTAYSETVLAFVDMVAARGSDLCPRLERLLGDLVASGGRYGTNSATVVAVLAEARFESGSFAASLALLDEFMPLLLDGGFPELQIAALRLRARLAYMGGDRVLAQERLDGLHELGERRGLPRFAASAWLERARLALLAADIDGARRALECAEDSPIWRAPEFLGTFANDIETPMVGRVRLALVEADAEAALALLAPLCEEALRRGRRRRGFTLRCLLAQAYWLDNARAKALDTLATLIEEAGPLGLAALFVTDGWVLKPMLVALQQSRPALEPAFVVRLQPKPAHHAVPDSSGVARRTLADVLSPREAEILNLVAAGLSNKEMARQLFRSETTIATHLRRIYHKLDARNRTQAVQAARRLGLSLDA